MFRPLGTVSTGLAVVRAGAMPYTEPRELGDFVIFLISSRRLALCVMALACVAPAGVFGPAPARAADAVPRESPSAAESASLDPAVSDVRAALPRILSDEDVALYRRIFALQVGGQWKAADRLVAKLTDRLLMGHVLAQRYLHRTKYRTRYKELKAWMAKYADHPDAGRLYKLALRRKPKNWLAPKPPVRGYLYGNGRYAAGLPGPPPRRGLTRTQRRKVAGYKRQLRRLLRSGWTKAAKRLLETKELRRLFSTAEYDQARGRLGARYFADGRDEWALRWAGEAADRSGRYITEAHWTAGLAAWRLRRYDDAGHHFEAVAAQGAGSPWMISAAAFWAARTHLVNRRPENVNRWLGVAGAYPRTFYGLLARRVLGLPMPFRWTVPPLENGAVEAVSASPAGRRAVALIRIGEERRAERELRGLATRSEPGLQRVILALASRADMPALAVRLDAMLFPRGGGYDGAAYPMPRWVPEGGFRIDRALIYALVRQESGFNPMAKSWAGARGLMQLMPRTASFVARDRRYRGSKRRALFSPEVNLALGQKYIEILLKDPKIKGDLFLLAAAWNGGPGNLNKWRRRTNHLNDPLFFIESIPSRETRIFVERVLANLWIYRDRLGQPRPSLDAIAAGKWPVYTALGQEPIMVAQHGEDRR